MTKRGKNIKIGMTRQLKIEDDVA